MRRKSKRNESADNVEHSSPEKTSRRSGRHSRRRKKSSSSPEQLKVDKHIPPEHASSEEHTNETEKNTKPKSVEGSHSPVETERVATPEGKGGSEASSSSSKSRRLKGLKQMPSDSQDDIKSSASQKKSHDESIESVQPKDDASSENKGEGGVVWKVQSANGSGGEIQKLKICRQRLNSSSDSSSTAPRRRLSRTFKGPPALILGGNEKFELVQETESTHCSGSNAPDQVEAQKPLTALRLGDDLPKEPQEVGDKPNQDQQETEIVANEEPDDSPRNVIELGEKGKLEGSISPEELQIHPIEEINSPPEPKEPTPIKESTSIDPSSQRRDQKHVSRSGSAGENSSSEGEDAKQLLEEAGNKEQEKPSSSSPVMAETTDSTEVGHDHDSIEAAVEVPPTIIETDHVIVSNESPVDLLPVVGKRRWGASKSIRPSKKPVLSISTDSLKKLIPEVKPVPAEEVQMNVEEEEEVEDGEMKDDDENDDIIVDKSNEIIMNKEIEETEEKQMECEKEEKKIEHEKRKEARKEKEKEKEERRKAMAGQKINSSQGNKSQENQKMTRKISIVSEDARKLARSPSPAHHRPSSVLFITNLVRPFTVPQLRELLARTGTIAPNGFWIDRIKSKCYVQYTDPEAAIETRHALHGVRWPVSNPKTLCVEFAAHDEMVRAQTVAEEPAAVASRKPELMDVKVERTVEGWVAEQARIRREDKPTRRVTAQVREWDVGKPAYMDDLFQERTIQEREYEERLKEREKEKKMRLEKRHHSPDSLELHAHKAKRKDEDAPAKLLDDLFRKTKSSPCIYWLPLTAEQIVVKEEMRRQHMAEHERLFAAEMKKTDHQVRRDREKRERRK